MRTEAEKASHGKRSQIDDCAEGRKIMRIFLSADLHYREHWFRWLLAQAKDYDLICLARDLLDMFRQEPKAT